MRHTETLSLPTKHEIEIALASNRDLAGCMNMKEETQHIQICDDENRFHTIEIPTSAIRLLIEILSEFSTGNTVKIIPIHSELTVPEAADILNVSTPYVVDLLQTGKLPFYMKGKHRRIHFTDLMIYKNQLVENSEAALMELANL